MRSVPMADDYRNTEFNIMEKLQKPMVANLKL